MRSMNRQWVVLFGVVALGLVQCGGSTDTDGNGGTAGSGGGVGGSGGGPAGSGGGPAGSGGTSADMFACQVPTDCMLRPASCCGSCGAATREDSIAINKQFASQYASSTCGPDTGCPACYMAQDPNLLATCRAGQCAVVDWLTHPANACQSPGDCQVRTNACCECDGPKDPDHLIAVPASAGSSFSQLVCDPNSFCPECEPLYPDVLIGCVDGHCLLGGTN